MLTNLRHILFIFLIIITTANIAYSINPQITITENVSILDRGALIDIDCNGTLAIYNPSLSDEIYQFTIKFKTNEDLQFTKNISTNNSNRFTILPKEITGREILSNETIYLKYNIKGTINSQYKNQIEASSVLNWYTQEINLDPLRYVTLSKLSRENPSINISPRKIVINGENPTNYNVTIKYLDVFKTSTISWETMSFSKIPLHTITNLNLAPMQNFNFEVIDLISDDETVYWLEYDIATQYQITNHLNISVTRYLSGNKKDKYPEIENNNDTIIIIPEQNLQIIKYSNQSTIKYNDTIEIRLIIDNPNNFTINNLKIIEKISNGFTLTSFDNTFPELIGSIYTININEIKAGEAIEFKYKLKLNKNISQEIIYIIPATLNYDNKTIYSNGISLFNDDFISNKKIYVEKTIIRLENGITKVTIKVKNIGNVNLRDLVVVEDMANNTIDITKYDTKNKFTKWVIDELNIGEQWEITYEIETGDASKYIPEVFGIDDGYVYKTLLINEEIRIAYSAGVSLWIKLLSAIAIMLLIVDILF